MKPASEAALLAMLAKLEEREATIDGQPCRYWRKGLRLEGAPSI